MCRIFLFTKRFFSIFLFICLLFSFCPVCAEEPSLDLSCKSAILMDADTGTIIYEQNSKEHFAPASVTKVMTLLLIMEAIDDGRLSYDDIVTASERAKSMGGSTIFLDTNEQMSVRDLLKGITVASANDACVAMAEHLAGSEAEFVRQMNERAKKLSLKDTNFVNTNGLDTDGHYSCAYDIAMMSRELMKHPDIFEFTTIWMDTLRNGQFNLSNTNKLIRFYDGATGLKTGSTNNAGCCISATAKRDDLSLIAVVMNAPTSADRFSDARTLLDYGFSNYASFKGDNKGSILGQIPVNKGSADFVNAIVKNDFCALVKKSELSGITKKITLNDSVLAPQKKGAHVGTVEYLSGDTVLGKCDLVTDCEVYRISSVKLFEKYLKMLMFHE